jgi:hypothetical protein
MEKHLTEFLKSVCKLAETQPVPMMHLGPKAGGFCLTFGRQYADPDKVLVWSTDAVDCDQTCEAMTPEDAAAAFCSHYKLEG